MSLAQLNPPLEITIDPNGRVSCLDPDFLCELSGTLTVERTSEILFDAKNRAFYIRLIKPDREAVYNDLRRVAFRNAGFKVRHWVDIIRVNHDENPKGRLLFPSYETAVAFEKWLIPTLRKVHGDNYV